LGLVDVWRLEGGVVGSSARAFVLRRSPIVAVALTARAHDCGPEPSLRTSPSSSSSPAFGEFLQIPSGASRLRAVRATAPTGCRRLGPLRC